MALQLIPVAKPRIARPAGAFQRPLVLPVVNDQRLFFALYRCNFRQFFQFFPYLHGFGKGAGILPPVMPDSRAVELFLCAAAGAPLEIQHTVRAVRHRLQGCQLGYAGLFLLGDRLPVGKAGAGFHQQEGFAFHGVKQVVHHGGVQRRFLHGFGGLVPCRVVVPAGDIDFLCHFKVIDAVKAVHHIGGEFGTGCQFFDGIPFKFQKINVSVTDKALPIQRQCLHSVFALRGGAFDLLPCGVIVAPETGVPRLVQRLQAAVARLQPTAELRLAQLAVAVPAHLVGDMPQDDCRVVAEALRQLLVDTPHFIPIQRRGIAVILPPVVQLAYTVSAHTAHLGVLVRQPRRACCAGGCQNRADPVGVQVVDDVRQPVQRVHTLLRLQCRPRKHAQRHRVDTGLFHQLDILRQYVRSVQPLLGVVVPAVK